MFRFFRSASAMLVFLLAVYLCGVASASEFPAPDNAVEDVTLPPVTVETSEGDKEITVNVTVVNESPAPSEDDSFSAVSDSVDDVPLVSYAPVNSAGSDSGVVVRDFVPTLKNGRSPLLDSVLTILGTYQPRTVTVSTYLDDGSIVQSEEPVPGLAGLDWDWLAGVVLFTMALYCIFRMIGGLLRWT